jgi:hypothetical protein
VQGNVDAFLTESTHAVLPWKVLVCLQQGSVLKRRQFLLELIFYLLVSFFAALFLSEVQGNKMHLAIGMLFCL